MPEKSAPIALLSAVPFEAGRILRSLSGAGKPSRDITTGRLGMLKVAHMSSGPGIANAASAATLLIERYSPSALVIFGIGGAYHGSGLATGEVAAAESETFAELGAMTPRGFLSAKDIALSTLTRGSRKYYGTFELDRKLLKLASGHTAASGPFLTVSTVSGTLRGAKELMARHGDALCENMEGAAAANVCARYGVPMLEIRGISNMVEERDTGKWEKKTAAENSQAALLEILKLIQ